MGESMIERVAKAIYARGSVGLTTWEECQQQHFWKDVARAAIEPMRDPTPEMRDAFWRAMFDEPPGEEGPVLIGAGCDAMIDAALAE